MDCWQDAVSGAPEERQGKEVQLKGVPQVERERKQRKS